jgi:hypothetical protein
VPGLSLVASQELWLPYLEDLKGLEVYIQPGLMASQEIWLPYLEDLTGLEVYIQHGLMASQEIWLPYLEDLTGLEVCARPEPRGLQTAEAVVWPPVKMPSGVLHCRLAKRLEVMAFNLEKCKAFLKFLSELTTRWKITNNFSMLLSGSVLLVQGQKSSVFYTVFF